MLSRLQTFNFNLNQVRIQIIDNKEYFCAKDVCDILGYQNSTKAIQDNCKKDGVTSGEVIDALSRTQVANFINEPNLLRLIIKSKLPEAQKFEAWVFEEILPTIRKTGKFEVAPQLPQNYIEALEYLVRAEKEKIALENTVKEKEDTIANQQTTIEKARQTFNQIANKSGCIKFQACARNLGISDTELRNILIKKGWRHKNKLFPTANGIANGYVKFLAEEFDVKLKNGEKQKKGKLAFYITEKGYCEILGMVSGVLVN